MKNVGNSSDGRSQRVSKISGHPCIGRMGALRGHLCDSTAFLFKECCRPPPLLVLSDDQLAVHVIELVIAGPHTWNNLPDAIRDSSLSFSTFTKLLKSYLFV